jgi:hypothetical protein
MIIFWRRNSADESIGKFSAAQLPQTSSGDQLSEMKLGFSVANNYFDDLKTVPISTLSPIVESTQWKAARADR